MVNAGAAVDQGVVGMVLDLQGAGHLLEKGKPAKLQLLSYLKPKMELKLDAGSKVSLSLYATRSVYQVTGPAVLEVGADQLTMLQGAAPVVKSMAEKLVVAAETTSIMPGAYRMRSFVPRIVLTTPENGIVLLKSRPTFSWDVEEEASYEITLQEQPDRMIVSAKVTDASWQLPADVALEYGKAYHWTVSYTSPSDGKNYSAISGFSLASKATADEVAALKPAASASIEEWIMYAAVLQNRQMREEARTAWQFIVTLRPDLRKAQELAR